MPPEERPARVVDIDVAHPLRPLAAVDETGHRYAAAHVLVRLDTEPLGVIDVLLGAEGVGPARLANLVWRQLGAAIAERRPGATALPAVGLPGGTSPYLDERARAARDAPPVSVVVATRDPDDTIGTCLDSVEAQDYPDLELIVVDNGTTTPALERVLARRRARVPFRCLREPRTGVSRARNAGWRAAQGRIVAFLDDDVVADPHWLIEVVRGFRAAPDVRAVTGPILPVTLDTPAQDWFEQAGGHTKGRAWQQAVFDRASHAQQHPLYPLPPFGASGNLAVDRATLAELGGFDVTLGPGTPARAGEDIAFLCDLMLAGHTLVFRPGALVRHHHHPDAATLEDQFRGYGTGLTAFYTRTAVRHPRHLPALLGLAPRALRDLFGTGSARTARMRADYPPGLEAAKRRGMAYGPVGYVRSRVRHLSEVPA
jgi:glycosyltransferase involved in cell wall biosynthesis